jgi:hypothetical protein
MRKSMVVTALVLAAAASPVMAQGKTVGRVWRIIPQSGEVQEFETALKGHMSWHRQQADTWTWMAFEVLTGQNTGDYLVGTFDHEWKEWDARADFDTRDHADVATRILPHVAAVENAFWLRVPEISRPADQPMPLYEIRHYQVKIGKGDAFHEAVGKIHKAVVERNLPWHYSFLTLASGGRPGHWIVTLARASWDDMKLADPSVETLLRQAYGDAEAEKALAGFRDAVESMHTELVRYRPDLSYLPAAK